MYVSTCAFYDPEIDDIIQNVGKFPIRIYTHNCIFYAA